MFATPRPGHTTPSHMLDDLLGGPLGSTPPRGWGEGICPSEPAPGWHVLGTILAIFGHKKLTFYFPKTPIFASKKVQTLRDFFHIFFDKLLQNCKKHWFFLYFVTGHFQRAPGVLAKKSIFTFKKTHWKRPKKCNFYAENTETRAPRYRAKATQASPVHRRGPKRLPNAEPACRVLYTKVQGPGCITRPPPQSKNGIYNSRGS